MLKAILEVKIDILKLDVKTYNNILDINNPKITLSIRSYLKSWLHKNRNFEARLKYSCNSFLGINSKKIY